MTMSAYDTSPTTQPPTPTAPTMDVARAQHTVETFFDAIAVRDVSTIMDLLTPNTVLVLPLSMDGSPGPGLVVQGREAVTTHWRRVFGLFKTMRLHNRRVTPGADGLTVFVEADGEFVTVSGKDYRNTYIWRIDLDTAGSLRAMAEYANPVAFAGAFDTGLNTLQA